MLLKHQLAIIFCVACSIFWIPQVYHFTQLYLSQNLRIRIQDYKDKFDFPDIYLCVFIDNTNLEISRAIPTNGRSNPEYLNFLSNLTLGEIQRKLRTELFSFSIYISSPFSFPNKYEPDCFIIHFTDGFEIFIKITCLNLEYYYASVLTIVHNISSYSLSLTEQGSFDGVYQPPRNLIPLLNSGHEHLVISVTKHTKVIKRPPNGPNCVNYNQDTYNDCKIEAAQRLLKNSLDVNTIVPIYDSRLHDHRFVNYVSSENESPGNISGCLNIFSALKCRRVQYDTISTISASNTSESKLSFMLDRSIDFTYDFEYDFPWPEYVLKVIEIVSTWLGFSVLSVLTTITETISKIFSHVSSILVRKLVDRVLPGTIL